MRGFRYALAVAAILFVAAVCVQVFLAGLFLFADADRDWHVEFGYILELTPLILIVLAAFSRQGWGLVGLAVLLQVDVFVQASLPWFATAGIPLVAALHPVNALLVLGLGVTVARRAIAGARAARESATHAVPGSATQASPAASPQQVTK